MDYDTLALLSFTENLGYLWPFAIGFMKKSWSVFEWQHFEKSVPKKSFHRLGKRCIFQCFGFIRKNSQLCRVVVSKPLDLHILMGYHWKDNIHIFHLVPILLKLCHWWGHNDLLEKWPHLIRPQNVHLYPVYKAILGLTYQWQLSCFCFFILYHIDKKY